MGINLYKLQYTVNSGLTRKMKRLLSERKYQKRFVHYLFLFHFMFVMWNTRALLSAFRGVTWRYAVTWLGYNGLRVSPLVLCLVSDGNGSLLLKQFLTFSTEIDKINTDSRSDRLTIIIFFATVTSSTQSVREFLSICSLVISRPTSTMPSSIHSDGVLNYQQQITTLTHIHAE